MLYLYSVLVEMLYVFPNIKLMETKNATNVIDNCILHSIEENPICIESTKTTCMEDVNTGVLEKIKNI